MGMSEVIYLDLFHHADQRKMAKAILEEGDMKIHMRKYHINEPALIELWKQMGVNAEIRKLREKEQEHKAVLDKSF